VLACATYAAYASYYSVEYERFLWLLHLFVIAAAIIGGGALCALFIYRPKPYQGAASTLHKLFSFRLFVSEELLCVLYACIFCGITAYSIVLAFSNVVYAAIVFFLGNLAVRVIFELVILFIHLCIHVDNIAERLDENDSPPLSPFSEESPDFVGQASAGIAPQAAGQAPVGTGPQATRPDPRGHRNGNAASPGSTNRNGPEESISSATRAEADKDDSLNSIISEALRQAKEDHTDF